MLWVVLYEWMSVFVVMIEHADSDLHCKMSGFDFRLHHGFIDLIVFFWIDFLDDSDFPSWVSKFIVSLLKEGVDRKLCCVALLSTGSWSSGTCCLSACALHTHRLYV